MRILYAIHDFLPRHRAGSELYAFHLARTLAPRHDVTVLCADYDPSRAHGSFSSRIYAGLEIVELVNNWAFSSFADTYRSDLLNQSLSSILPEISPDILHVHNLLNLSMDLPALAHARGIPSVATLHDYTLLCPSGGQRVHVAEQHVCHTIDVERCSRCFPQSHFASQMGAHRVAGVAARFRVVIRLADVVRRRLPVVFRSVEQTFRAGQKRLASRDIRDRLQYARRVFDAVDLFVAPSQALASEYQNAGLPAEKIRVSDYGFVPLSVPARKPGTTLRVGFVGTLVWHKGVHVLLEAIRGLSPDRYVVRLYGDTNVFPAYVAGLRDMARDLPVEFMGGFDETRLADVYGGIDVLVVPSLWPENSPLVIHEAFMAGVPVVGARQGGIPELVTHGLNGLVYDSYSSKSLATALQQLLDDPQLVARFAANVSPVKSIEHDAAEWEVIYRRLTQQVVAEAISKP